MGTINKIVNQKLMDITPNKKNGKERYPKCIPVHLAQTGNCFPLQKKDLSGFLWQKLK